MPNSYCTPIQGWIQGFILGGQTKFLDQSRVESEARMEGVERPIIQGKARENQGAKCLRIVGEAGTEGGP